MKSYKNVDKKYVMNTYNRFDLEIVKGNGCKCYDVEGKEYIDLSSGIGVNCLGYSNPKWAKAVAKQAKTLSHISNLYYSQPDAKLAKQLCSITGYNSVFFGNSGAEANEGAIKLARKYSFDKYGEGRATIITLVNSFHGRTITTLTATGQDVFHNYFYPFTPGFKYAIANDIESVKQAMTKDVCAVMVEFIQGEGGVIPLNEDFVSELYSLCKKRDILFVADEVQTGIGRTGKILASKHYGILPDVTTMAKSLGGGLPIGAFATTKKLSGVLGYSMHGTTFGGNPIVCAGAKVVLDTLTDEFLAEVEKKGEFIKQQLSDCSEVAGITGKGLMIGISLNTKKSSDIVKKGIANGIIMLTAKEKIRLLPPLTISYEELEQAMNILKKILSE